jgi:hypothetical protein
MREKAIFKRSEYYKEAANEKKIIISYLARYDFFFIKTN